MMWVACNRCHQIFQELIHGSKIRTIQSHTHTHTHTHTNKLISINNREIGQVQWKGRHF